MACSRANVTFYFFPVYVCVSNIKTNCRLTVSIVAFQAVTACSAVDKHRIYASVFKVQEKCLL
jgi:hypothetical protein